MVFGGGVEGVLDLVEIEVLCNVKFVFGEVMMLLMDFLVGEINFIVLLCYDDYNDVGSIINFKIGIDYKLIENMCICV